MPRGVYDRSKVKAAPKAKTATAVPAEKVGKRPYKRRAVAATAASLTGVGSAPSIPAQELRDHTSFLVSLRPALVTNPDLLGRLDGEIKEMLEKAGAWRKSAFSEAPAALASAESPKEPIPPPSKAAPVPLSQPVAPIPFTPANVSDLQKATPSA
jgi:hypothetical protein